MNSTVSISMWDGWLLCLSIFVERENVNQPGLCSSWPHYYDVLQYFGWGWFCWIQRLLYTSTASMQRRWNIQLGSRPGPEHSAGLSSHQSWVRVKWRLHLGIINAVSKSANVFTGFIQILLSTFITDNNEDQPRKVLIQMIMPGLQ